MGIHNHRWEEFQNHSKEDSRNSWEVSHTVGPFIITAGRSSVTIPRRIVVMRVMSGGAAPFS